MIALLLEDSTLHTLLLAAMVLAAIILLRPLAGFVRRRRSGPADEDGAEE